MKLCIINSERSKRKNKPKEKFSKSHILGILGLVRAKMLLKNGETALHFGKPPSLLGKKSRTPRDEEPHLQVKKIRP